MTPLVLVEGERIEAEVVHAAGDGWVILRVVHGESSQVGVARIGAIHALPGYQPRLDLLYGSVLAPGRVITVAPTMLTMDMAGSIPVLDAQMGEQSLSQVAVAAGYAVPMPGVVAPTAPSRSAFLETITSARTSKAGYWADIHADTLAIDVLGRDVAGMTMPATNMGGAFSAGAVVVMLALVIAIAWRDGVHRRDQPEGSGGRWRRLARFSFGLGPGSFRKVD